jgi:hypothetical protein
MAPADEQLGNQPTCVLSLHFLRLYVCLAFLRGVFPWLSIASASGSDRHSGSAASRRPARREDCAAASEGGHRRDRAFDSLRCGLTLPARADLVDRAKVRLPPMKRPDCPFRPIPIGVHRRASRFICEKYFLLRCCRQTVRKSLTHAANLACRTRIDLKRIARCRPNRATRKQSPHSER